MSFRQIRFVCWFVVRRCWLWNSVSLFLHARYSAAMNVPQELQQCLSRCGLCSFKELCRKGRVRGLVAYALNHLLLLQLLRAQPGGVSGSTTASKAAEAGAAER